jgi:prepilin-type N-terminal cleavage/methylation domain-containing protein
MRGNSTQPRRPDLSRHRAFSLVELLVAIAVVALLIGILLPVVKGARGRAMDARCLSNHRQFGVAWSMYFNDYDNFPVPEGADAESSRLFVSWGGIDWRGEDYWWLLSSRPLNKYLAKNSQIRERAEVFMCPRDNSLRYSKTDDRIVWETLFGADSWAEEEGTTAFSCIGNSYAANDWMYCQPGATQGWGGTPPDAPYFRLDLGPDDVRVAPSRFVLVCDWGSYWAGRYDQQGRINRDLIYGWWHGYEIGQMTFLDGSARRHEMGAVTTQDYTFYLDPGKHPLGSWRTVYQP